MTMDANPRAVVGNNQPPAFDAIKLRVDNLVETANRWATERPAITDQDMAGKCSDFLDQISAELKAAEDHRTTEKAPHLAAAKAVDDKWNPLKRPLEVIQKLLKPRLDAWLTAEKKRIEAEKAAKEAEALKALQAAEEAAKKAAEAQAGGGDVVGSIVAAEEAAKKAAELVKAADAAPERATVKGNFGTRAKSLRTYWGFEITDKSKVPLEFLVVDQVAVNKAIREAEDPSKLVIPGIAIKSEQRAA